MVRSDLARIAASRLAFIAAGGPAATQAAIVAGVVHPLAAGSLTGAQAAAAAAYAVSDQAAVSVDHTTPPLPRDVPWRDPTSDQAKTLTAMAVQLKLSQWKSNTTPQHFFNLIEGALQPIGLSSSVWVAIIPLMIPTTDTAVRQWVTDNITNPNPRLSWNAARRRFTDRYGQQDYRAATRKLYQDCRQSSGETAQAYSQRFLALAVELKVDEKDAVAIHQYEIGLVFGLRRAIETVRITNRTTGLAPNREWSYTSLHELSQLAIQLETSYNSRNSTSLPSTNNNSKNPLQSPHANPPTANVRRIRTLMVRVKVRLEVANATSRAKARVRVMEWVTNAQSTRLPSRRLLLQPVVIQHLKPQKVSPVSAVRKWVTTSKTVVNHPQPTTNVTTANPVLTLFSTLRCPIRNSNAEMRVAYASRKQQLKTRP